MTNVRTAADGAQPGRSATRTTPASLGTEAVASIDACATAQARHRAMDALMGRRSDTEADPTDLWPTALRLRRVL